MRAPAQRTILRAIDFMRKYMADRDANVAASKNAAEMKAKFSHSIQAWERNSR
jgi:hypothetical protein